MTPAEELLLHLINLVASAGLLFMATSRDVTALYSTRFNRVPVHTSWLSGQQWLDELVSGHPRRFHNEMGLHKHVFMKLICMLGRDAGLALTRHVLAEEQLAIFLHYVHWGCHDSTIFISFYMPTFFFFFYLTGSCDFSCHKTSHDLIT